MSKKKKEIVVKGETVIDDLQIFERVANIIETRRSRAGAYANSEIR